MGRHIEYPLSDKLTQNLDTLILRLNRFRAVFSKPMVVSSGYRPERFNIAAGGALNSPHLSLEACDFHDPLGDLDRFCLKNVLLLEECNLYLESPKFTPGWCHLQTRPTKYRIFIPNYKLLPSAYPSVKVPE